MIEYIVLAGLLIFWILSIVLIIGDKKKSGYLYVFDNNELYLQLTIPIEEVRKHKRITFQIDELHDKESRK